MGDEAVKPTRHGRMPRATKRDNNLTVLTPPVGLPATPEAASRQPCPAPEGGDPVEAQAKTPGAARAPVDVSAGTPTPRTSTTAAVRTAGSAASRSVLPTVVRGAFSGGCWAAC